MVIELFDITFLIDRIWENGNLKKMEEINLENETIPNHIRLIKHEHIKSKIKNEIVNIMKKPKQSQVNASQEENDSKRDKSPVLSKDPTLEAPA